MVKFDDSISKLYDKLMNRYKDVLNGNLKKMLEYALNETDEENKRLQIEAIKAAFNLSDEDIKKYMVVLKIEHMYRVMIQDLNDILELISGSEELEAEFKDDLNAIEEVKNDIEKQLEKILDEDDNKDIVLFEEDSFSHELVTNCNFVIYLSNVDDERNITLGTRSGIEYKVLSSVSKEISMLCKSNYELLRQNSKIHQINEAGRRYSGREITSSNLAYERVGGGTTKVGYIRVPVCQENLNLLRKRFDNNNFRYIMLVICFGDFANEKMSEKDLYLRFNLGADKAMNEIEKIVKMFYEPFTPESFEIAVSMIENGIDITNFLGDEVFESLRHVNAK